MKVATAVRYACFGAVGVITALADINILDWKFWTILTLMAIAVEAGRYQ